VGEARLCVVTALGAAHDHEQKRRLRGDGQERVEELHAGVVGPVQIVEAHHGRPRPGRQGEQVPQRVHGGLPPGAGVEAIFSRFAQEQPQGRGAGGGAGGVLIEVLQALHEGLVGEEACDDVHPQVVRQGLTVGDAAPGVNAPEAVAEAVPQQAALAHPRRTQHGDEAPGAEVEPLGGVAKGAELQLTADERRATAQAAALVCGGEAEHPKTMHGLLAALERHDAPGLQDRPAPQPRRRGEIHPDLPGPGLVEQARGDVHPVAQGRVPRGLPGAEHPGDHDPGAHRGVHLNRHPDAELLGDTILQRGQRVEHIEGGAHGALGVVFVG
jgi:hypothetical protein